jgi:cytochrome c2
MKPMGRSLLVTGTVVLVAIVALVVLVVLGIPSNDASNAVATPPSGAKASDGKRAIEHYGCGSCHTIGGVSGADGKVAPDLTGLASRRYIAGRLPLTSQNLEQWVRFPQRYDPGVLMPDLGVSATDARDIAAYLLRR